MKNLKFSKITISSLNSSTLNRIKVRGLPTFDGVSACHMSQCEPCGPKETERCKF